MPPGDSVLAGRHCSLFVTIDVTHEGFTYIYDPAMYPTYTQNDLSASVAFTWDDLPVSLIQCHISGVSSVVWRWSTSVVSSVVCTRDNQPADDEVEEDNGVESEGLPPLRLTLHQERHRCCNKKTYVLI